MSEQGRLVVDTELRSGTGGTIQTNPEGVDKRTVGDRQRIGKPAG